MDTATGHIHLELSFAQCPFIRMLKRMVTTSTTCSQDMYSQVWVSALQAGGSTSAN